jgi:hypothetical protein
LELDPTDPKVVAWRSEQAAELADWLSATVANFMSTGISAPPEDPPMVAE